MKLALPKLSSVVLVYGPDTSKSGPATRRLEATALSSAGPENAVVGALTQMGVFEKAS